MSYIARELERKFKKMSGFFKAVLVTGARQVGKTTMLRRLAEEEGASRTYVSLDEAQARDLAKRDPALFFQSYRPPILLDEVQKAPELFERIKILCDGADRPGLFWLTGSQQYGTMQGVRETLAGRVGILDLYSFSQREKLGLFFGEALDFSLENWRARRDRAPKNNIADVFRHIWEGGMPQTFGVDGELRQEYYNSYVAAYLMRDVAEAGGITDAVRFRRFLEACAALVAEPVNYKKLAEASDISQPTARSWLQLLQALGIVYLLPPYANNALKRLVKTPKLYFCDTGLCAALSMWLTPDVLQRGAAGGHFYENYVVIELVKHYAYAASRANLTYYRDAQAREVDLFIEENNVIHPLEIKQSAHPDSRVVKKYALLDQTPLQRGRGGIVCMCEEPLPIDQDNCFIPCNLL